MAPGRKSLRKLQIGRETTAGTSAAATVRLRVKDAVIADLTEVEEMEEQIGYVGGPDRTIVKKYFGNVEFPDQPATFEQLPYFLAMCLGGPVAGTSATSTDGAVAFATSLPLTTSANIKTYTFEGGDDHEAEKMTYGYCTKLKLSGKGGEVLQFGATIEGRQVTTAAGFTTSSSAVLKPVEDIVFSKGKIYIDPVTSSAGTSQIVGQIVGAKLDIAANIVPKWTADGELYFTFATFIDHAVTGKLTFEHDTAASGASGAKADWRSQTAKMLRLEWTGSAITSGNSYPNRLLRVDLPVKWKVVSALSDDKGNDLVMADFRSRYSMLNSTAGNGTITLVTSKNDGSTSNGNLW